MSIKFIFNQAVLKKKIVSDPCVMKILLSTPSVL